MTIFQVFGDEKLLTTGETLDDAKLKAVEFIGQYEAMHIEFREIFMKTAK